METIMETYYQLKNSFAKQRIKNYVREIEDLSYTKIYFNSTNKILIEGTEEGIQTVLECLEYHDKTYSNIQEYFYENNKKGAMKTQGYQEFDVSNYSSDAIRQTIGRKGYNFIYVTEYNGINSIWHDKKRQVIEFWGDIKGINRAKMEIIKKLNYYNKSKYHFKHINSTDNELIEHK